ncbi:MAG TPA: hypothetical protein VFK35_01570 [Candidatus Limnocylindrales bacterium]|nr:hypothetical protein [Candidatus Limnocylindrales bacterium]
MTLPSSAPTSLIDPLQRRKRQGAGRESRSTSSGRTANAFVGSAGMPSSTPIVEQVARLDPNGVAAIDDPPTTETVTMGALGARVGAGQLGSGGANSAASSEGVGAGPDRGRSAGDARGPALDVTSGAPGVVATAIDAVAFVWLDSSIQVQAEPRQTAPRSDASGQRGRNPIRHRLVVTTFSSLTRDQPRSGPGLTL